MKNILILTIATVFLAGIVNAADVFTVNYAGSHLINRLLNYGPTPLPPVSCSLNESNMSLLLDIGKELNQKAIEVRLLQKSA